MSFVTIMLSYERTERSIPGLRGSIDDERFGWVVRINGLDTPRITSIQQQFSKFTLSKDQQLELTCFEEDLLSYDNHDQFHPPMAFVTKILGELSNQGYLNTSSTLSAERNEITYCLWNFQLRSS